MDNESLDEVSCRVPFWKKRSVRYPLYIVVILSVLAYKRWRAEEDRLFKRMQQDRPPPASAQWGQEPASVFPADREAVKIAVHDGHYAFEGAQMSAENLRVNLEKRARTQEDPFIVILVSLESRHTSLVALVDLLEEMQLHEVSIISTQ